MRGSSKFFLHDTKNLTQNQIFNLRALSCIELFLSKSHFSFAERIIVIIIFVPRYLPDKANMKSFVNGSLARQGFVEIFWGL